MVTVLVLIPLATAALRATTTGVNTLAKAKRIRDFGKEGEKTRFADFSVTFTEEELEGIKANQDFALTLARAVERAEQHKTLK